MNPHSPESILAEARIIARRKGILEPVADSEWSKFAAWFMSLGATELRWWDEWPKWLDKIERGL